MAGFDDLGDGVRKLFLVGVGAVATGAEKSTEIVNKLVEKGELNNLSLDRFIALISAMGAHLDVRVSDTISSKDAEMNRLIKMIATENLDADMWGIAP